MIIFLNLSFFQFLDVAAVLMDLGFLALLPRDEELNTEKKAQINSLNILIKDVR